MRIGDLLYSGRKNCFSLFNLESEFLGQNYGHNILFPGAAPMYLGMTASPMVFPRPTGGQAWLWERGQLMGFSTKVIKGRKGSF